MTNGKGLISEERLELKHISWETRAVFRTVGYAEEGLREASKYAAERQL